MTIPDFQTVMRPSLELLADGETRRARDVVAAITELFELTDDEREQLLPSGRQRVIDNRVGWALRYLSRWLRPVGVTRLTDLAVVG